jgi:hypothetical protein
VVTGSEHAELPGLGVQVLSPHATDHTAALTGHNEPGPYLSAARSFSRVSHLTVWVWPNVK